MPESHSKKTPVVMVAKKFPKNTKLPAYFDGMGNERSKPRMIMGAESRSESMPHHGQTSNQQYLSVVLTAIKEKAMSF